MLESAIKSQLQMYLERMPNPVELVASLDNSEASSQLRSLLQDILDVSPRVSLREEPHARTPSFGIARAGETPRVRFAGLPLGHEFTSLVLALLQVSGYPPKVEAEVLEQIASMPTARHFEVFMSLSCHNCPDVVQAAVLMAAVNPNIQATVVDGALFQAEVESRGVMAVPTTFLNGELLAAGRMGIEEMLAKVDDGAVAREAVKLTTKAPFDVLVVGGGPAGAAAAVYAARKGIRTGVVADRFGGQTNDTLGIENYISVLETQGPKFAADLEAHVRHYGVDVMTAQRASKLVPASTPGGLVEVHLESGAVLRSRSVVLSTGARWRNVGAPGEQEYKNKGVAYCPHCDGPLFKGKRTAVIGGGNSGVEAAIDLAGIVEHVTLLEFGEQLKADAVLVKKLMSLPNVAVLTQAQTLEFKGDGVRLKSLRYRDRATQQEHELAVEGVFVQIGLVPNTEFLRDTVELNRFAEIVVDSKGHTNVDGVFAAGDATTSPYKQIVVAAGDGAKAALSAFDYLIRTPQPTGA